MIFQDPENLLRNVIHRQIPVHRNQSTSTLIIIGHRTSLLPVGRQPRLNDFQAVVVAGHQFRPVNITEFIHAGRLEPAKIDVRVLLPSRDIDLAFPTAVAADASAEDAVHDRWLAQRNAQGQVLRHNLLALRATHGIDVHVTFRALPFTPPVKLYLLNGAEALFAYYTLGRHEREIDHEHLQTYDAEGTRSMLFAFEQGTGLRDTMFVDQSTRWFDALWETIGRTWNARSWSSIAGGRWTRLRGPKRGLPGPQVMIALNCRVLTAW